MATKKQKDPQSAPKIEFSKLIFLSIWFMAMGVTIFTCWVTWESIKLGITDFSALVTLIGAVFAELATGTAFYYWKTKHDNRIKLKAKYGMDITDEDL